MSGTVLCLTLWVLGQSEKPPTLPSPPLSVAKPADPPKLFGKFDLSRQDPRELTQAATQLAREGKTREAVQLQFWSVRLRDKGRYDLACWYALDHQKDAAFYWLQQAAMIDGADADHADNDDDLESLRGDRRWAEVSRYIKACNAAWSSSGRFATSLVLPKKYVPGKPIGVVIGLHGLGHSQEFIGPGDQPFADELDVAFLGVSGTIPTGRSSYVWAEDPEKDGAHVRQALRSVKDRVTVDPARILLFGFSQGAIAAFEIAFRYPDEFRGAIPISPGGKKFVDFDRFKPVEANRSQGYVLLCGAAEAPGNVLITEKMAEFARNSGCRVQLFLAPRQEAHTFPEDFSEKFGERIRFILKRK